MDGFFKALKDFGEKALPGFKLEEALLERERALKNAKRMGWAAANANDADVGDEDAAVVSDVDDDMLKSLDFTAPRWSREYVWCARAALVRNASSTRFPPSSFLLAHPSLPCSFVLSAV